MDASQQFRLLKKIGKGSFGQVYKAVKISTNEVVAIKELDLEAASDEIEEMNQEIALLCACDSPFVTRYHASYLMEMNLWIVMDYCGVGSIRALMKSGPIDEKYMAAIANDVLNALVYLHKNKIIHRDIKAANILMTDEGIVKLCDFGVAGQISMNRVKRNSFVGTPYWMAPEVIQRSGYDIKADIWSFGITMHEIAIGQPPYVELEPMKAILAISKEDPPVLTGPFSRYLKEFTALCLRANPSTRPTAEELLKHKFVKHARKNYKELLDLVSRHQKWLERHPAFEEDISPEQTPVDSPESEGWNFETIKPDRASRGDSIFEDGETIQKKQAKLDNLLNSGNSKRVSYLRAETGKQEPLPSKFKAESEYETDESVGHTTDNERVEKSHEEITDNERIERSHEETTDNETRPESVQFRTVENFETVRSSNVNSSNYIEATVKSKSSRRRDSLIKGEVKSANDIHSVKQTTDMSGLLSVQQRPVVDSFETVGEDSKIDISTASLLERSNNERNEAIEPDANKWKRTAIDNINSIPIHSLHLDFKAGTKRLVTHFVQHLQESVNLIEFLKENLDQLKEV